RLEGNRTMADQPSALHATRVRLSSHGQRWTRPLAAAQAPAHAHSDFSLLPVWKGSSFQRPCGNFLRLAAHDSRSCAIAYSARGKVAQSVPSIPRLRRDLIVGVDTRTSSRRRIWAALLWQ